MGPLIFRILAALSLPMRYWASDAEGSWRMKLKSLSLNELTDLRDRVEAALASKVADQRRNLQAALGRLSRIPAGGARIKSVGPRVVRGVAPKYRNPDNPAETWAGRGLKPRWLAAALKAGKKLEDFSLSSPAKEDSSKDNRKKVRKAKRATRRSATKKASRQATKRSATKKKSRQIVTAKGPKKGAPAKRTRKVPFRSKTLLVPPHSNSGEENWEGPIPIQNVANLVRPQSD
jgi:DNA-binding protein H-NS